VLRLWKKRGVLKTNRRGPLAAKYSEGERCGLCVCRIAGELDKACRERSIDVKIGCLVHAGGKAGDDLERLFASGSFGINIVDDDHVMV